MQLTNTLVRAGEALGLVRREDPAPDPTEASLARLAALIPRRTGDPGALSFDAVFRAVLLLQTLGSQISFDAWRGSAAIDPRPAILDQPDVFTHRAAFVGETIASMATRGEGFWKHYLNPSGQVTGLSVLDPLTTEPLGSNRFNVNGVEQVGGISHLQLLRRPGHKRGLGPIQACAESLTGAVELRRWADGWLKNAAVPPGTLQSDQPIDKPTATRYKNDFKENVRYTDGPLVLGSGLKYSALLLKPEEMQWIEAQNFNVTAVARMFGLPARHMLASVEGSSETYANLEQDEIALLRGTLMRYINEIEAAFTAVLPRGTVVRANLESLLRTDTKTRYEGYKIGLDGGFITIADIAGWEHLPPDPDRKRK